jgi:transcriptional regulator with XRE-family HTH domain
MTRNQRLVRMLRGLSSLSQGQLARKTGLSSNRIAALEAGDLEPTAQDLQRIAEQAGLTAADAEQLMRFWETLSTNRQRYDQGSLETLPVLADVLKQQLATVLLRLLALPGPDADPEDADPAHVEDMMNRLRSRSHEVRIWVVRVAEEFQSWALGGRVCDEAARLAAENPEEALQWAELAEEIVEQLEKPA